MAPKMTKQTQLVLRLLLARPDTGVVRPPTRPRVRPAERVVLAEAATALSVGSCFMPSLASFEPPAVGMHVSPPPVHGSVARPPAQICGPELHEARWNRVRAHSRRLV